MKILDKTSAQLISASLFEEEVQSLCAGIKVALWSAQSGAVIKADGIIKWMFVVTQNNQEEGR